MTPAAPLVGALARCITRHQIGSTEPVQPPAWITAAATEIADAMHNVGWNPCPPHRRPNRTRSHRMNRFDWHDPATHPPVGQLVIVHAAGLRLGVDRPYEWHIAKLAPCKPAVAVVYADDGWAPWVWLTQDDDYHDIISDQRLGPMAWTQLPETTA